MKKLLLADDHKILLDGLVNLVNEIDGVEIVAMLADGQAVIDYLKLNPVDIVCLDIEMPKKDGVEVAKLIKQQYPNIKVMILSMYNRPQLAKELVRIQVDAYVKKDAGKLDFTLAIEKLMAGDTYYSQHFTKSLIAAENAKDRTIRITNRELEVLKELQLGLNTTQISEKFNISKHTVQAHRKNLNAKFKVDNVASLIQEAIKKGFLEL